MSLLCENWHHVLLMCPTLHLASTSSLSLSLSRCHYVMAATSSVFFAI